MQNTKLTKSAINALESNLDILHDQRLPWKQLVLLTVLNQINLVPVMETEKHKQNILLSNPHPKEGSVNRTHRIKGMKIKPWQGSKKALNQVPPLVHLNQQGKRITANLYMEL
jgi:hypothetical protein